MAYALVTGNHQATESDAGGTSLAAPAFTNNVTTNDILIVSISWGSDTTADDATVDDGGVGLTWVRTETGPTYDGSQGVAGTLYYAVITAGGGTKPTITAKFWTTTGHIVAKSVSYAVIEVAEFSGNATASVLNQHGVQVQAAVSGGTDVIKAPSTTVTPASDGQLIFGFTIQSGGATGNTAALVAGTNFTEIDKVVTVSPAGYFYETEYYVQPTAAAIQATWSLTGTPNASDLISLMATFNPAAGGADTLMGQGVM